MLKNVIKTAIIALLVPGIGFCHFCDNVFRQGDKLVIKPDVTNLIIKDSGSFKLLIQNNMDRGIVAMGVDAECSAFYITVEPNKQELKKGKIATFDISLKLKKGYSSGSYPINFKIVGRGGNRDGKEITTYSLSTAKSNEPTTPLTPSVSGSPNSTVKPVKSSAPKIDGKLEDECWKDSAVFTNFYSNAGGKAKSQTVVLATYDQKNIYFGVACADEAIENIKVDKTSILICPDPSSSDYYKLEVYSNGKYKLLKGTTTINVELKVATSVDTDKKTWFIEAAIPLTSISVAKLSGNESWKLNIMRYRYKAGGDTSFWSGTFQTADTPSGFGKIQFSQ